MHGRRRQDWRGPLEEHMSGRSDGSSPAGSHRETDVDVLTARIAELEATIGDMHARRESERQTFQEMALEKVEVMMRTCCQEAEEKIAKRRKAASKAQEQLNALRHAISAEGIDVHGLYEDAHTTSQPGSAQRQHLLQRLGEAVHRDLVRLQEQTAQHSADDPDVVAENINRAVARCFRLVVQHYEEMLEGVTQDCSRQINVLRAELNAAGDGHEASTAAVVEQLEENFEQERQRMALVCIRMKSSLQHRSAALEQAVMGKANDLVGQYESRAEAAEKRCSELEQDLAAAHFVLMRQQRQQQQQQQQQQQPPHASDTASSLPDHSSLGFVKEMTREVRSGLDDSRLHFERDAVAKAQQLVRKYLPVVQRARQSSAQTPAPISSALLDVSASDGGQDSFDGVTRVASFIRPAEVQFP